MTLDLMPITLKEADEFVRLHNRHHGPVVGSKFAIGLHDGSGVIVGVVIVGRPVARRLDKGWTAEVTRLCTDGTKNAASKLYAAAWRACRALGYKRLITYILDTEPGTSLKAAGWKCIGETPGKSWSVPSRPRVDTHPLQRRLVFEIVNS